MKEIYFEKERVASIMKFSKSLLSDMNFVMTDNYEDCFIRNEMAAKLESYLYKRSLAEQEITVYCDKPKFLDWLFGRRKSKTFKINIEDVLENPPITEGCKRLYEIIK